MHWKGLDHSRGGGVVCVGRRSLDVTMVLDLRRKLQLDLLVMLLHCLFWSELKAFYLPVRLLPHRLVFINTEALDFRREIIGSDYCLLVLE